ncbi:MAG: fimbrillin family protein [Bacteroidales bacterium]|nr:fimbrillin family protein [Bacteroidales bacterium]
MKTAIRIFVPGMMVLGLISCTLETPKDSLAGTDLQVSGAVGTATRAVDDTWSAGDLIGVTAVTEGLSEEYANACYALDGISSTNRGSFSPASEEHTIYLAGDETVEFTAYCPYQESSDAATLPGSDGVITDISTLSQSTVAAQEAIDFIFAPAVSTTGNRAKVNFTFSHEMVKLVIELVPGTDMTAETLQDEDNDFGLSGLCHTGSFCVTDGTAKAETDTTEDWDLETNTVMETTDRGLSFTAILFPQTPELTLLAKIDGEEYDALELTVPEGGFTSGNAYTYTITVNALSTKSGAMASAGVLTAAGGPAVRAW